MKVFLKGGKAASEESILALELALKISIPSAYRDFLRTSDGAAPESNMVGGDNRGRYSVRQFIPGAEIMKERSQIENIRTGAFPIAYDACGNYFLVDVEQAGAVFFWDHEQPWDIIRVADGLCDFLDLLEPFDTRTVALRPEQVKRIWVDPVFLEKLKDKAKAN